ncbi:hypothetical protein ARTHRO9V_160259 [Arthrobacter sp. 9V]|nr:hypothetical protein ARTHRO9V_160259 [Arthrobacter sp. 9V]
MTGGMDADTLASGADLVGFGVAVGEMLGRARGIEDSAGGTPAPFVDGGSRGAARTRMTPKMATSARPNTHRRVVRPCQRDFTVFAS